MHVFLDFTQLFLIFIRDCGQFLAQYFNHLQWRSKLSLCRVKTKSDNTVMLLSAIKLSEWCLKLWIQSLNYIFHVMSNISLNLFHCILFYLWAVWSYLMLLCSWFARVCFTYYIGYVMGTHLIVWGGMKIKTGKQIQQKQVLWLYFEHHKLQLEHQHNFSWKISAHFLYWLFPHPLTHHVSVIWKD